MGFDGFGSQNIEVDLKMSELEPQKLNLPPEMSRLEIIPRGSQNLYTHDLRQSDFSIY